MTHQKDLRELMLKRIKGLQREAEKLRRQSGASMDPRTRSHLRTLAHESKRKAEMLQARYDKLFADHLEPPLGLVVNV
ncbi:hypothetical protein D3C81_190570 [compost metagenome]